jgi:hypothetical protein
MPGWKKFLEKHFALKCANDGRVFMVHLKDGNETVIYGFGTG